MINTVGFFYALLMIISWSCQLVITRYAATVLNTDPFIFVSLGMVIGSLIFIVIGGNSKYLTISIKSKYTWFYSITHILLKIFTMISLFYISSFQSMILIKINVVISLLISYFLLRRKNISKHDFIGSFILLVGVSLTFISINSNNLLTLLLIILAMSILSYLRTNIAERHHLMQKSKSFKQQCQILGFVLFSICILMFFSRVVMYKLGFFNTDLILNISNLSLLLIIINGLFFIPTGMYLFFKATKHLKSENLIIVTSFMPIFTLAIEYIVSTLTDLKFTSLTFIDSISVSLIIIGGLYLINKRKKL